jgi:hypothetical protein
VQAADARVVEQAVRVRSMVLLCVVAGVDGGGGLHWLEPIVEVACM